ncbi:MAG: hypothetical protein ACK4V6_06010 [Microthrixaceae bacterium]
MISTIRRLGDWYPLRPLVLAVGPWVVVWLLVRGTVPVNPPDAWFAFGLVVGPVSLVALGSSNAGAASWALARGARFSPNWNVLLWHHLTRTRVARTLGVTLGIAVPMMINGMYNAGGGEVVAWWPESSREVNGYWMPALGYVIGSMWAEVRKPRLRLEGTAGAALLSPRRLGDYLDPGVSRALGGFTLAVLFVATVSVLAPLPLSSFTMEPEWTPVVGPTAVAALALGGAWWVSHRVERAVDDAALAYEELTRTATVNALAGAGIAMLGELSVKVASIPHDGYQVSGWWLAVPGLLSLLGLGVWIGCGTKLVFRSRRIDALRAAA